MLLELGDVGNGIQAVYLSTTGGISNKNIKLVHCTTKEQLADVLTKALLKHDFVRLRNQINDD